MSNRVIGSAVKAAIPLAAAKQVAAAGLQVRSCQIVFEGRQAYAVWDQYSTNRYGAKTGRSFRINYPALADHAVLSRAEADLIAAYTLHETGHVIFTNNDIDEIRRVCAEYGVSREIAHPIANGLEDGRMENAVITKSPARNARGLFRRLLTKLVAEINGSQWNPCEWRHAAFAAALLSRQAFGNGNAFTAALLDRIPGPKGQLYRWLFDQCATAPVGIELNSVWSYNVACQFVQRWRALEPATVPPDQPDAPPPADSDECLPEGDEQEGDAAPGGEEEGEDDGGFGDLDPKDNDIPDDDGEFDDAGDGIPDRPEGDEPEEGAGGMPDSPFEPEGEQEEAAEQGEPAEPAEPAEAEDSTEVGEADGGGPGGMFDFKDVDSAAREPSDVPEPNIDDLFARVKKRTGGAAKSALPSLDPARFEDPMDEVLRILNMTSFRR